MGGEGGASLRPVPPRGGGGLQLDVPARQPLTERREEVGHQDFLRRVVTGQVVHRDREVARITLGAGDICGR